MTGLVPADDIGQPMLVFALGVEFFAVPAEAVREILDPVPVTRVPTAPHHQSGLINVRGRIVPLADLRPRLGMAERADTIDTRFIVLELRLRDAPALISIRAEKVHEVTDLHQRDIRDVPQVGLKWPPDYLDGVCQTGGRFILLPNLETILAIA